VAPPGKNPNAHVIDSSHAITTNWAPKIQLCDSESDERIPKQGNEHDESEWNTRSCILWKDKGTTLFQVCCRRVNIFPINFNFPYSRQAINFIHVTNFSNVGKIWGQWDNFDIFSSFRKLADTFKVRWWFLVDWDILHNLTLKNWIVRHVATVTVYLHLKFCTKTSHWSPPTREDVWDARVGPMGKVARRRWAPRTVLEFPVKTRYVLYSWKTSCCPWIFSGVLENYWICLKFFI